MTQSSGLINKKNKLWADLDRKKSSTFEIYSFLSRIVSVLDYLFNVHSTYALLVVTDIGYGSTDIGYGSTDIGSSQY